MGNIDVVKKGELLVDIVKFKNEDLCRIMKCKFCVMFYDRGNCLVYGVMCYKCNGRNYYVWCCLKLKNGMEERRVCYVEVEEYENNELLEGLYIEEI